MTIRQLVDLYGRNGFDVLCVTDHVTRKGDPTRAVARETWHAYVHEIAREAERAERMYGLILIPGAELTDNHADPDRSSHALALGLRDIPSLDDGIVEALHHARGHGSVIIAAHPYSAADRTPHRATRRLAQELDTFEPLVHRWELFNRRELFTWVAEAGLPAVATGDTHRAEHLASWKTVIPADRDEEAVLAFLRSPRRTYLLPFMHGAEIPPLEIAA